MDQSVVSVDVVALRFWADDAGVTLGVAPRAHEPFTGELALPGVLLGRGERLAVAARRAVHTKLGVPEAAIGAVGQLITFDEPNRDPRGPTLSLAMWAVVAPHEGPADWVPFDEVPALAFDHNRILEVARGLLARLLWKDVAFTRALLGPEFPATRAVDLAASLLGTRPDPANLNRTLAAVPGLHRTEERRRTRATGRPAAVWAFEPGE
ncbi:NUDIX hydrolase [Nocardia puris]|uniref:ADP-ribose pyrophosphatase YjhB (NUDIX family) n=1 Tax=Nocardia puris TaxID=208602 RepID=A0A366E1N6_9NOCA|nr:NUDIX hydrolase [Nocardia puris]MBF6209458.1 NUDIX hydrolase [Nocardia puris]MBF6367824.1 NUDIX hydrolase [Nocardia puris]MBF6461476.1 NUDIX hydrolase [Nocardia puris]RBO96280.1 ADP-ribose pyrophosphatase YjhB (NUDIX family) [Nocardia puris]